MTQTINPSPPANWQAPPPPPAPPTKRSWKTRHLAAVGVVALIFGIGIGGSGGTTDTEAKDTQTVASAKAAAAATVVAAEQRAADAEQTAQVKVDQADAARKAALDARSADLDKRAAALRTQEAAKKAATFDDGQYQVGVDIVAGTYHTDGHSGCYWEKSTGGEGIDGIIANDNVTGPVTLTIDPSVKFFKTSHCGTWTKR